jgi:hypothetical protein
MAYGFRLNVEAVYWREAIKHFETAKESVVERDHCDPITNVDSTFKGYSNDDALAPACMAVVCFAICVEAAVNYVWNEVVSPKYPNDRGRKKALRTYHVTDKISDISELHDGSQFTGFSSSEIKKLKELFDLRNRFVHFKEMIEFTSFSSASEVELLLAWDEMIEFQTVSKKAISWLSTCSSLDPEFLEGDFEVVTIDA